MTDNAKELLALTDRLDNSRHLDCFDEAMVVMTLAGRDLVISALRLSARQQASARNLANAILDAPAGSATAMARALLAEYDIFEKAEG